jgi:hypothetical protein
MEIKGNTRSLLFASIGGKVKIELIKILDRLLVKKYNNAIEEMPCTVKLIGGIAHIHPSPM